MAFENTLLSASLKRSIRFIKIDAIFTLCLFGYFAYGRNVNVSRLRERIGNLPLLVCGGILPEYKFTSNKVLDPTRELVKHSYLHLNISLNRKRQAARRYCLPPL